MAERGKSLDEILECAIAKERAAHAIYSRAAEEAKLPSARRLLREMAQTEAEHEKALRNLDIGGFPDRSLEKIEDLRIAEFLKDVDLEPRADFQTILVYAIKREQKSRDFYEAMAEQCNDAGAVKLFKALAAEEQAHKSTLEKIYDDEILVED